MKLTYDSGRIITVCDKCGKQKEGKPSWIQEHYDWYCRGGEHICSDCLWKIATEISLSIKNGARTLKEVLKDTSIIKKVRDDIEYNYDELIWIAEDKK